MKQAFTKISIKKSYAVIFSILISLLAYGKKDFPPIMQETINLPMNTNPCANNNFVQKQVLENGMTVLVKPVHTVPKVVIELWYGVGSKDETDKERGIAHLIEHMIFKGTNKLSESDINVLTHNLSGSCNAFTNYDYTGYIFTFPTQHWQEALPVMADCMTNCTFNSEMLSSEMKAVIQELKMYRDKYVRSLFDELISMIFSDHPYHHPIIGYKQDLWSVSSEDLLAFYRKHYLPNNATLIVVGDVQPEEVFAAAKSYFSAIPADTSYKHNPSYASKDISARSVTLYRDIQQPIALFSFVVPGVKEKKDYALQALNYILGQGKSSRLHTRLVEELHLATSVSTGYFDLFDYGLFYIICEPTKQDDIEAIRQEIYATLEDLTQGKISDQEIIKAEKLTRMHMYNLLEDSDHQANEIGKYFLATGDENFAFTYLNKTTTELKKEILHICATYMRPSIMHSGFILPLPPNERSWWKQLQETSDAEDTKILAARVRTLPVQQPQYAYTVKPRPFNQCNFPKPTITVVDNGLKILSYANNNVPTIELILDFKVNSHYDPAEKQGLCLFMSTMLNEGTSEYNALEFAQALEERGIILDISPGKISMNVLREDLAFALHILNQMVTSATFDDNQIEKIRKQFITEINNFWDNPREVALQKTKEAIYKNHPYAQNSIGTLESIKSITKKDLIDFYKKHIAPSGTRLAIVGDFDQQDAVHLIEQELGTWKGPLVNKLSFPSLEQTKARRITHYMNRDQVSLMLSRLSINRTHPDFDKLLLFDQVLSGGALGSLSSRLFELREQSGLFYTIRGCIAAGAEEEPGMFLVSTIVSMDRLQEAETAIRDTLKKSIDSLTPEELEEAKRAIQSTTLDRFKSNDAIARTFLFVDRYNLPLNYFDIQTETIAKITLEEVKQAARTIVQPDQLVVVTVGRVEAKEQEK